MGGQQTQGPAMPGSNAPSGVTPEIQKLLQLQNMVGGTGGPPKLPSDVMPPNESARMGPYTTQLSSAEEKEFRQWLKKNSDQPAIANFNPDGPDVGYDMRGFWKGAKQGDPRAKTAINPSDQRLHFTDVWKTPSHPSFSAESQYAMPDAPKWKGSDQSGWYLQDKNGKVIYDERLSRNRE